MSTWVVMPSDDDVIHGHKYIDKIMGPNGKWRYIYYRAKIKAKNAIGVGQKGRLERAKANVVTAEAHRNAFGNFTGNGKPTYLDKVIKTKREEKRAQEAYDKTLLGKIDQVKDAGLKAWDSFTSLFKKEETKSKATITNKSNFYFKRGKEDHGITHIDKVTSSYTPPYSTKKSPTTSTRGTAYSPSYKKGPTTSSRGTAYTPPNTQPRLNIRTSSATSFMRNNSNKVSSNKGGLVSSSKQNPGIAIGADVINKDKKKKRRRA